MGFFEHLAKLFSSSENSDHLSQDDSSTNNIIIPSIEDNIENEGELIAVLTAAIMASYGSPTNCNLKITSFRRINNSSPAWNIAGRQDNLNASL